MLQSVNNQPIFYNFDLHISASQEDSLETSVYLVSVQQSLAGETRQPVEIQIDLEKPSIQKVLMGLEYRDISRQALRDFGIQLANWLLPPGPIRNRYQQSLGQAEALGNRLRLRLRIDPPELSTLPWEYMYDESTQEFFALKHNTALVRYHNQPIAPINMIRQTPISILILIAEPEELNALPYSHSELINLLQALKHLREQEYLQVDILYGGASRLEIHREVQSLQGVQLLDQALSIEMFGSVLHKKSYHVVHYIGHSQFDDEQGGVLLITNDESKAIIVGAERLAREMQGSNTSVVVLNGCQSAEDGTARSYIGLAPRLIQIGIPAVVAMQYDIPDQAAMRFSRQLYQSLANGQPLDAAVVAGRIALTSLTQNYFSIDWGIPALFMRSHDGMLWKTDAQSDKIQTTLQQFSQQLKPSIVHEGKLTALTHGINRHLDHLKNESTQGSKGGPYRGLLTYRLGDAEIFFGRERDVEQLLNHLDLSHLTILHSESGAGKSSLLHAGLAPRLIAQKHLPIHVRSYNLSPTQALKRLLVKNLEQESTLLVESLRSFLYHIYDILEPDTKLYIILDQFEEFFLLLDESTQFDFIQELADCLEDRTLEVYWIISLRREHFGELANLQPRITQPFANQHYLKKMSREQAYMVIDKPAAHYGIYFEQGLIQRLIDDLNQASGNTSQAKQEEEGVVPSQLQLVCLALYEELETGQTTIDHTLYDKLGGVAGILQNHLENVLRRGLPASQRGTARFLLEALITSQTQRVMRTRTELAAELGLHGITDTTIYQVINQMVTQRLLRVTDSYEEAEPVYELAHDYLIQEIELSEEVKKRKKVQELLESEVLSWRASQTLISPERLKIINKQRSLLYFDDLAAELLARSALETDQDVDLWFQMTSPELIRKILLGSLKHEDSAVRARSITYLTPYFDENIEQKLIEVVTKDSSPEEHKAALTILVYYRSSSALQIALDDLQHIDPNVRSYAVLALQEICAIDAGWKGAKSTDSENSPQKSYLDLKVQQALFTSAITDDDLATWTQAVIVLNTHEIEPFESQPEPKIKDVRIFYYVYTFMSSLTNRSAAEQYWSPLLKASLSRQSATYREFNQTIKFPSSINFRLLLDHIQHLTRVQIQRYPLSTLCLSLLIIAIIFVGVNNSRNRWMDSNWVRYMGHSSREALRTISTADDQILVGTYKDGLAWFHDSWETNFVEGFPKCRPIFHRQRVQTNECTIFSITQSYGKAPQEEFYALIEGGIYRYEHQKWIALQPLLDEEEDGPFKPGKPFCRPGIDVDLTICTPLAVYGDLLLVLAEKDMGIWASHDRGEKWKNLKEEDNLLDQKFSSVIFDRTGTPYAGGKGGLYRGIGDDYFWEWERLHVDGSVKNMAISSDRLYLTIVTSGSDESSQVQKIGCYKIDANSGTEFTLMDLPVTNRLLSIIASVAIEDIEPHPSNPEIFYIVDSFAAVYEMNCNGHQHRIGQKSAQEVPKSSLAIWKDVQEDESYLLWANYSGLYRYTIPLSQESR